MGKINIAEKISGLYSEGENIMNGGVAAVDSKEQQKNIHTATKTSEVDVIEEIIEFAERTDEV